jgi:hypothetical protein
MKMRQCWVRRMRHLRRPSIDLGSVSVGISSREGVILSEAGFQAKRRILRGIIKTPHWIAPCLRCVFRSIPVYSYSAGEKRLCREFIPFLFSS